MYNSWTYDVTLINLGYVVCPEIQKKESKIWLMQNGNRNISKSAGFEEL